MLSSCSQFRAFFFSLKVKARLSKWTANSSFGDLVADGVGEEVGDVREVLPGSISKKVLFLLHRRRRYGGFIWRKTHYASQLSRSPRDVSTKSLPRERERERGSHAGLSQRSLFQPLKSPKALLRLCHRAPRAFLCDSCFLKIWDL